MSGALAHHYLTRGVTQIGTSLPNADKTRAFAPQFVRVPPHILLVAEARATTTGWLVAEGDSWFDYPGSLREGFNESVVTG